MIRSVIVIVLALAALATVPFAKAQTEPDNIFDPHWCAAMRAQGEPWTPRTSRVANVLCCCKTHNGGECCTRLAQCGGKPPGCFCASPTVPSAPIRLSIVASTAERSGCGVSPTHPCP